MKRPFTSALQIYMLITIIHFKIFQWTTVYLLLTVWLSLLFLLLPQYLHNSRDDDEESNPKPLNMTRLITRIKLEPHIQLVPLAFVDSLRCLLI